MFSSHSSQVSSAVNYIEDVMSTYLYTGNGSTQTITNGIDLAGKGGLVWGKRRNSTGNHFLVDTVRGSDKVLISDLSIYGSLTSSVTVTGFNSTGFGIGAGDILDCNNSGGTYVSWTFREQPKFFDVVTWSGSGINTTIPHSLGSVPGSIIVKRTDTAAAWAVYHRSLANTQYLVLNTTAAAATGATWWNSTTPTSAVFSVGTDATVNASGGTYIAYIFAHDAGGFGLTGTDNVISCGSFTTTTSPDTVTLGYEPQWVLIKSASSATSWYIFDNMRGIPTGGLDSRLMPNLSAVEQTDANYLDLTATGFTSNFQSIFGDGINLIYIAIRRGPMKVPTLGTSVYTGSLAASSVSVSAGFVPDLAFVGKRDTSGGVYVGSRLQGSSLSLNTYNSTSEAGFGWVWDGPTKTWMQASIGADVVDWLFARAPSVCDVVCYTGSGSNTTKNHNLGAVPELIILKGRDAATPWACYSASLANTDYLVLRTTAAAATDATYWNSTTPTSSVFSIGTNANVNTSAATYVAYLFATLAGVSKVGSYTGNGTTQTIDCGFGAGGARWVMIKRTDSTGSWYVYDTARGMTVLTDPYLLMNSNAAEVATLGSVTTVSTGFALNSTILAAINVSAGSYIFLAIA